MTHRVVSSVVSAVVIVFIACGFAFAWAVDVRAPGSGRSEPAPAIPHDVDGETSDCTRCHGVAGDGLPVTHRHFGGQTCTSCHTVNPADSVPHAVSGQGDRCTLCHGDASLPLGMPTGHLAYGETPCELCHTPTSGGDGVRPLPAGLFAAAKPQIPHPVNGIFSECLGCHQVGGRPPLPASHAVYPEDTCRYVCHVRASDRSGTSQR